MPEGEGEGKPWRKGKEGYLWEGESEEQFAFVTVFPGPLPVATYIFVGVLLRELSLEA